MGAFDPLVTYEKGTFIGELARACLMRAADGQKRTRAVGSCLPLRLVRRIGCPDEKDKVSRRAVITGATNIVLGGKSIIQSGQPLQSSLQ